MTNTKPQVKIVNATTGEEIIRDANAEELAQIKLDATNEAARKADAETNATAKAALLNKLGITAEEARLLLS
jgi:DNA-binding protein YbaB